MTFNDYEEFIYLNTKMTNEETREFARECWNNGLDKFEALEIAREQENKKMAENMITAAQIGEEIAQSFAEKHIEYKHYETSGNTEWVNVRVRVDADWATAYATQTKPSGAVTIEVGIRKMGTFDVLEMENAAHEIAIAAEIANDINRKYDGVMVQLFK